MEAGSIAISGIIISVKIEPAFLFVYKNSKE